MFYRTNISLNLLLINIYIFFLFLPPASVFCQHKTTKAEIKWGAISKILPDESISKLIGYDEFGYYMLKYKKRKESLYYAQYFLQAYANNMQIINENEIKLKEKRQRRRLEKVLQFNGKLYIFTSGQDKKLKKTILSAEVFDKKNLAGTGYKKNLGELVYFDSDNWGNFNFALSNDSSKLLIAYEWAAKYEDDKVIDIKVFDKNLEIIWQENYSFYIKERLCKVVNYNVDNESNAYLMMKLYYNETGEQWGDSCNYKYHMYYMEKNKAFFRDFVLTFDDKLINQAYYTLGEKGIINCFSLYSNFSVGSSRGFIYHRIEPKIEKETKYLLPYDLEYLKKFQKESVKKKIQKKTKSKRPYELHDVNISDIKILNSDTLLFLTEQYSSKDISEENLYGTREKNETFLHLFKDISFFLVTKSGKVLASQRVPKRQEESGNTIFFSSYQYAVKQNNIYFLFNDDPRNIFHQLTNKLYTWEHGEKGIVSLVVFKDFENYSREVLFYMKDSNFSFVPQVSKQLSDNKIIALFRNRLNMRLGKIMIE